MLQFTISRDADPNGTSLRRLLEAHVTYERMSTIRSRGFHLVAIVSVVIWVGAMWPSFLPPPVRELALTLWGILLFFTICAGIEEWIWHRRVTRYRSEHQAKQNEGAR